MACAEVILFLIPVITLSQVPYFNRLRFTSVGEFHAYLLGDMTQPKFRNPHTMKYRRCISFQCITTDRLFCIALGFRNELPYLIPRVFGLTSNLGFIGLNE